MSATNQSQSRPQPMEPANNNTAPSALEPSASSTSQEAAHRLAEAIDDFLGDLDKKFSSISNEILTRLDDMAERCDRLEQEMLLRDQSSSVTKSVAGGSEEYSRESPDRARSLAADGWEVDDSDARTLSAATDEQHDYTASPSSMPSLLSIYSPSSPPTPGPTTYPLYHEGYEVIEVLTPLHTAPGYSMHTTYSVAWGLREPNPIDVERTHDLHVSRAKTTTLRDGLTSTDIVGQVELEELTSTSDADGDGDGESLSAWYRYELRFGLRATEWL